MIATESSPAASQARLIEALQGIARLAARLCPAAGAAVVLVEDGAQQVVASAGRPTAGTLRGLIIGGCSCAMEDGSAAVAIANGEHTIGVLEVESTEACPVDANAVLVDLAAQVSILLGQQRRITCLLELAWHRSQAANRLIESEEQFRLALDALSARIVVLDGNGRIVAVNRAWRNHMVAENGPLPGPGENYLSAYRCTATGSVDDERTAAGIQAVATGMQGCFEMEYAGRATDSGRYFSLRVTRFPRRDRHWVVVTHTDITDRQRAQEALRDSRERFAGIIGSALDAIITIDDRNRITLFNAAAERMFGWRSDEVCGSHIERLLPSSIRDAQLARLRAMRGSRLRQDRHPGVRLLHGQRRGGEDFPIEASVSRLETSDGVVVTILARDVTERERAQQALRHSEERWALAVQGSNDGIWDWNIDHGIYFSQRCHEMLGYAAEEFPHEMEHWLSLLHPDDREPVCEAILAQVLGATPLLEVEYRARCRDGSWKWLLTRGRAGGAPGRSATRMAGSTTDISARKTAEIALRESQARNAAIIDSSLDAILKMDSHGRLTNANPAAERMFGWRVHEAVGRHLATIVIPPSPPEVDGDGIGAYLGGGDRGAPSRLELEALRADGTRFPVEIAVVEVQLTAGVMFIGHLRDLSEQRAAEARMRRHEQQLIQSEKMVALGTLVSGVAHEINNPANFISLNTPLLLRMWHGVEPILEAHAEQNPGFSIGRLSWNEARTLVPQCHDGIQEGVRRIKRIVNDLKDFARDETPGLGDQVDLNAVVAAAVRLVDHPVRKWTHSLRLHLADDLPTLTGSHQRLEQVVINLVINACHALPNHDRAIHLRTSRDSAGDHVVLEVEDEGAGISAEVLPRILEPFFTTKRDIGGTGLGLSVSASIIAEHGGSLTFSSIVGVGTTARITLPVERQPR